MSFAPLDPLLHNQLRLAIVSLLVGVDSAEFTFIVESTGATRGNISVQITKLKEAGYISVTKSFRDNYPLTTCKLTAKGLRAFEKYVEAIRGYLDK
ncbi:MAG: transcriptional regulator [Flavobacteriales bacterium]|nr:transcriptional regulator [Flavobacteriales bacterium]